MATFPSLLCVVLISGMVVVVVGHDRADVERGFTGLSSSGLLQDPWEGGDGWVGGVGWWTAGEEPPSVGFGAEMQEDEGVEDASQGEGDEDEEIVRQEAELLVFDVDPALCDVLVRNRVQHAMKLCWRVWKPTHATART